eukprot:1240069-Prymnesium_polylepis.1
MILSPRDALNMSRVLFRSYESYFYLKYTWQSKPHMRSGDYLGSQRARCAATPSRQHATQGTRLSPEQLHAST